MDEHVIHPSPLDPCIAEAVSLLQDAGIATYESCQGGAGHMVGTEGLPEPFVSFRGNWQEGFAALALFLRHPRYTATELRRVWRVIDGEPEGPTWKIVFRPIAPLDQADRSARTHLEIAELIERVRTTKDADAAARLAEEYRRHVAEQRKKEAEERRA